MSIAPQEEDFFCPNCGDWYPISEIQELVGWCIRCAKEHHPTSKFCLDCKNEFSDTGGGNVRCPQCKEEHWLSKYADLVEDYMLVGYSFTAARDQVELDIRPRCRACGGVIVHAKPGSMFCNQHDECKKARSLYNRSKWRKNLSPQEALVLVEMSLGKSFT